MFKYLGFLLKCIHDKLDFISFSSAEKARYLADNNLTFWAGLYYMDLKEYENAAYCFKKSKAYKHLIIAYKKLGYYQKAIKLADEKKYYKLGASICMYIGDYLKAAYFYSFFDSNMSAKLYQKENHFFEAGYSYLSAYNGLKAIKCFNLCRDTEKVSGLKEVGEFASVLYFTKQYKDAFPLFINLNNFYAAHECAKKLKSSKLIESTAMLIADEEATKKHYKFAAKCIEKFNPKLAIHYYSMDRDYKSVAKLLINEGNYERAVNICLFENDLNFAYEIASIYSPALLDYA